SPGGGCARAGGGVVVPPDNFPTLQVRADTAGQILVGSLSADLRGRRRPAGPIVPARREAVACDGDGMPVFDRPRYATPHERTRPHPNGQGKDPSVFFNSEDQ